MKLYDVENMYQDKNQVQRNWVVPFEKIENKNIIAIYGAGDMGQSYYEQIKRAFPKKNILWFDRRYKEMGQTGGEAVLSPDEIELMQFDCIIIAISKLYPKEWTVES